MPSQVYFATNRNRIESPVPNNFGTDFNAQGEIVFGRAVLQSVKDESELGNSNIAIDGLSVAAFLPRLSKEIVADPADHLLITLHGFDYRFREAIMRAGYVAAWFAGAKPKVPSVTIAFTWPSLGSLTIDAYRTDYRSSGNSASAFRLFLRPLLPVLTAFKTAKPGRRVSLMAHSMGNHFLRSGIAAAVGTAPGQIAPAELQGLIDNVYLLASDEDADALSRPDGLAPVLGIGALVHLYYNNQDLPLNTISRNVHGVGRLGIDGPPDKPSFRQQPIEFINCSACNPTLPNGAKLDPQWHQYYRLVPQVRDDICATMLGKDGATLPRRAYRKKDNYYRLNL